MSDNNETVPHYEICMSCGTVTDVLIDLPIDCRRNYIVGCGQLCEKCASALERDESTPFPEITNEMLIASLRKTQKENSE